MGINKIAVEIEKGDSGDLMKVGCDLNYRARHAHQIERVATGRMFKIRVGFDAVAYDAGQ